MSLFTKLTLFTLFFLTLSVLISAHETEIEHEEPLEEEYTQETIIGSSINSWESVSPIHQFKQRNILYALFLVFLWIVSIGGILTLASLILRRIFIFNKK